ncbi:hypothetical protein MKW98_011045 [Papaver atlanticum]|uniref:SEP domain-containing protein n=1 Tax=Papaver atlanticum TaxID=357466 RepID=A0AAD4TFU5_9MAGN|nr:hypothetical protein MKW98_011045 [Papaver atlanticum]
MVLIFLVFIPDFFCNQWSLWHLPLVFFSQLSVSTNPPPSRDFEEPIDFSELFFCGSLANVPHHKHVLVFEGNYFTVNGGPERDPNDPCNAELLESVKNYKIPEEFAADGMHTVRVLRTFKSLRNVEVVRDKRLDEYDRFMSCGLVM